MVFEELLSVKMPCQVRNTRNIVRELDLLVTKCLSAWRLTNTILLFLILFILLTTWSSRRLVIQRQNHITMVMKLQLSTYKLAMEREKVFNRFCLFESVSKHILKFTSCRDKHFFKTLWIVDWLSIYSFQIWGIENLLKI